MTATKQCRDCGSTFTRSRADSTVRCPPCRRPARQTAEAAPTRTRICGCGKTVIVDGFGTPTRNVCPICNDR